MPDLTSIDISFGEFVRKHPSMFFDGGIVTDADLASRLLDCAVSLGATSATALTIQDWQLVGAEHDWFKGSRVQISDTLTPSWPAPAPEWAQNSTRPEMLISLLARDLVLKVGEVVTVIKGTQSDCAPVCAVLASSAWVRAVAFRHARLEA